MNVNTALPEGIDISSYQDVYDWSLVENDGIDFAFIKATESTNYVNPKFSKDWIGSKGAYIYRGAYHFSRPSQHNNPEAEVNFFIDTVNKNGGFQPGDTAVFDIEDDDYHGDVSSWFLYQLEIAENILGFKPIVYTGKWYLDSKVKTLLPKLKEYPLWLADYRETFPSPPAPWDKISFWQYTDKGNVAGIRNVNNLDLNVFNGAKARIPLLGKPLITLPPLPVPPSIDIDQQIDKIMDKITTLEAGLNMLENDVLELKAMLNEQ